VDRDANDKPKTPVKIVHVTIVREGQDLPPLPAVPAAGPLPSDAGPPKSVGGGVSAPVLIYSVEPDFSEAARKLKSSGNVKVGLWVDQRGIPTQARVVHGVSPDLDAAAVAAVKQYKFKPAMEDGKPVLVAIELEVNFQLF